MSAAGDIVLTYGTDGLPTTQQNESDIFGQGTVAGRPVSGNTGDLYIVVDGSKLRLERWNGSAWTAFQADPIGSEGGTHGDILYRNASQWTVLAAGTSGQFLKTQGPGANPVWDTVSGGSGSNTDLFLVAEPTTPNNTYSFTKTGGKVTQELWVRTSDASNLKTIDYTYTGSKLTTEVRKVYAANGVTIVGQMTLTYSYSGSSVSSIVTTRDV